MCVKRCCKEMQLSTTPGNVASERFPLWRIALIASEVAGNVLTSSEIQGGHLALQDDVVGTAIRSRIPKTNSFVEMAANNC